MALAPGTPLGAYEVLALLGSGGMGEVYRARDTKLGRDVALKILPLAFTTDAERVARFRREAQVLASLNHPQIGAIYGLEEAGGSQFLVLELVEGESLDKRVARGPIPISDAIPIAAQIAEALEAAHQKGIVHRDLKPANIAVTSGGAVKVLDFGLAKAVEPAASSLPFDGTRSPTMAMISSVGTIVGTAAYMSPEQARGKTVDKRADIWAFGCVLYEMLTGRCAFSGETATDVIAAVVGQEPAWEALPAATPARIRRLLRRCLVKDPALRLRDAGDARLELDDRLDEQSLAAPARRTENTAVRAIAAVVAGVAIAGALGWMAARRSQVNAGPITRWTLSLPADAPIDMNRPWLSVAISRDGRAIAYIAAAPNDGALVLRRADDLRPQTLAGTTPAWEAFFSPDGQWIGFLSADRLKKVAITGGQPVVIADAANYNCGVWADDGTIYLGGRAGLAKVRPDGTLTPILRPASNEAELSHPDVLPDGSLLFTIKPNDVTSFDDARIAVLTPKGERRILLEGGASARYSPTGHIVYVRAGQMMAVSFDASRLAVSGRPVVVMNDVAYDANTSVAFYALSRTGVLTYIPGGQLVRTRSMAWLDRQGNTTPITTERRTYAEVSVSPDERQLALTIRAANDDVWTYDLARGSFSRMTFPHGNSQVPVWSADGSRLVYALDREGVRSLVSRPLDSGGGEEPVTPAQFFQTPGSASRDGKLLAYEEDRPGTGSDIFVVPLEGRRTPVPFMATRVNERSPQFSPDGRWIAFESDETGRFEVFVAPYPGPGRKWQLSDGGGSLPGWRRDGREIVYRNGNQLMSVNVTNLTPFESSRPRPLVALPAHTTYFAMTPSAERFLVVYGDGRDETAREMNVVLNWFTELASIAGSR